MSFQGTTRVPVERGTHNGHGDRDGAVWRERTRLVLTPIAAPSILGLFGLAGATFVVAAYLAGWYGSPAAPIFLFPSLFFGGLAQLVAGFYSYTHVTVSPPPCTACGGRSGSPGGPSTSSPPPVRSPFHRRELHGDGLLVRRARRDHVARRGRGHPGECGAVHGPVPATGSTLAAIAYLAAASTVLTVAGYVLVASAIAAWYTAGALMINGTFRREVLPLGHLDRHVGDDPMGTTDVIEYPIGMPGAHAGQ